MRATFVTSVLLLGTGLLTLAQTGAAQEAPTLPTDDPAAALNLPWTGELKWAQVVCIADFAGGTWDERLTAAQETLAKKGGGVVYFPAGEYEFADSIRLKSGILLRGATPAEVTDARNEKYDPPARLNFPQYRPTFEGRGTPVDTAFKAVRILDNPLTTNGAGLVNLAINHGHIDLSYELDLTGNFAAGKGARNLIVYGCVVRNAATPDYAIPMLKVPKTETPFQEPWQRWTNRHHAAINIFALENVLVANNRLPASGEDNFVMKGYKLFNRTGEDQGLKDPAKLQTLTADVLFDYDNRPGISVNHLGLSNGLAVWDPYVAAAAKTPPEPPPGAKDLKPPPAGLAQGLVIHGNYVYCTGCTAIRATGDGTVVAQNVIRYKPKVILITARGYQFDAFTNNNRAVEMRGWRWTMEGNDYEVHSNIPADGKGHYGDGEGLFHEAYTGTTIVDSKVLNNKGNAYICIWRVPVDGLLIQGNQVDAIRVLALTNKKLNLPAHNVRIIGNSTDGAGIEFLGGGAVDCVIKDNRQTKPGGKLNNPAGAALENNTGYEAAK